MRAQIKGATLNIFRLAAPYLLVLLAAVLLAFNYQLFIVKNNFAPAGLNGIATMIQYKTGFSIGYMSLLINIPLCLFAFFFIDKKYAVRSLCFCLAYSGTFLYLQKLGLEAYQYDAHGTDTIFPVILSGVISGFVYNICFRSNASTGGTDIVSKYISKRMRFRSFFWVMFALNALVASASFFVYATPGDGGMRYDYKPVCLCLVYCFFSSYVGNYLLRGTREASKFTVITEHPEEITQEIFETLHHGVTNITATGSYSHESKSVIICIVNKHQIVRFQDILAKYKGTFAFSEKVDETYGNFRSAEFRAK